MLFLMLSINYFQSTIWSGQKAISALSVCRCSYSESQYRLFLAFQDNLKHQGDVRVPKKTLSKTKTTQKPQNTPSAKYVSHMQ